jgi:hypothetical protein
LGISPDYFEHYRADFPHHRERTTEALAVEDDLMRWRSRTT